MHPKLNPFGPYKDFKACVKAQSRKPGIYSPGGYCASIERRVHENPEPAKELAWRRKQKPGAIMSSLTFQRIEREARRRGYDDPKAVAGAAYWRTVRAKSRKKR